MFTSPSDVIVNWMVDGICALSHRETHTEKRACTIARDERAGEKKRAYAPCEWKDTSAFSDSYVTKLRYKNALTNDTFRDIRFADEFCRDVRLEYFFISVCGA